MLAEVGAGFEIGLCWKPDDGPGIAVFVIPKVMLTSIAQDDEWSTETDGVFFGLRFCRVGINCKSLRFDYTEGPGAGVF